MGSSSTSATLLSSEESLPKIRSPSPSLTLPPDVPEWKHSLSLRRGLDRPLPLPLVAPSSILPPLQIPPPLPLISQSGPHRSPRRSSRRTKVKSQTCCPSDLIQSVQMGLWQHLHDLDKRCGKDLVDQAFERIAFERGVPHVPEACRDCMINGFGDWLYCHRAHEHVEHVHHRCPIQQSCNCSEALGCS